MFKSVRKFLFDQFPTAIDQRVCKNTYWNVSDTFLLPKLTGAHNASTGTKNQSSDQIIKNR